MSSGRFYNVSKPTAPKTPIYVFSPVGSDTKLLLCILFTLLVAPGCIGNCFVVYFFSKKKPATTGRTPARSVVVSRNMSLCIFSLAISDILCFVSIPLICFQVYFDVFQRGWSCRMVRYINILFPAITINNLVVMSVVKYLSVRFPLRVCRTRNVLTLIKLSWLLGILVTLVPSATFAGIRYDINATHFTVICRYDGNFYPFKITMLYFPLQYVLPTILLLYINMSLIKAVWERGRVGNSGRPNNPLNPRLRAAKLRGTTLLISITFAFFVPYIVYIGYILYKQIVEPKLDYSTDYFVRYASGGLAMSNSTVNFTIYVIQVRDFRSFLKNIFCSRWKGGNLFFGSTTRSSAQVIEIKLNNKTVEKICIGNCSQVSSLRATSN